MKLLLSLYILVLVCMPAMADLFTNYITVSVPSEGDKPRGPSLSRSPKEIPDKDGVEFLPASRFPKGNWGKVTFGLQVSLRLDKKSYKGGEPIVATVLIRNSDDLHLTNQLMGYMTYESGCDDGPSVFEVCNSDGKFLASITNAAVLKALALTHGVSLSTARFQILNPGTQNKFVQRLDGKFSLVSGHYHVTAMFNVLAWKIDSPDGKKIRDEPVLCSPRPADSPGEKREPEMLEVESAPVPFEIDE